MARPSDTWYSNRPDPGVPLSSLELGPRTVRLMPDEQPRMLSVQTQPMDRAGPIVGLHHANRTVASDDRVHEAWLHDVRAIYGWLPGGAAGADVTMADGSMTVARQVGPAWLAATVITDQDSERGHVPGGLVTFRDREGQIVRVLAVPSHPLGQIPTGVRYFLGSRQ